MKMPSAAGDNQGGYQAQPWNALGMEASRSDINLERIDTAYPTTHGPPTYVQEPTEGRQFV